MMSRTSNSQGTSISNMAAVANNWGADLVLSIHNNAGGGDGFEVYYSVVGGTGKILAQNIETEIKKLGQNSRGCKTRKGSGGADYYGMIRLTNAPAVICEGFFVDNAMDVKIADTVAEQKAFGQAYARGALKTLGIADKGAGSTAGASNGYLVRVSIPDLYIRTGPGTNYNHKGFIKPSVYTIAETKGSWGRLKSGAGWIHLGYTERV